jgi:2-dehydro-3-deoxyphosphogluconate aldolase/(4S)-4-hydroxy-2-oxoglutarate aldolase
MFQDLFGKQPLIISLNLNSETDHKIANLTAAGLTAIELLDCSATYLAHLRALYPHLKIGYGGITSVDELEKAHQLQVDFMSTPGFMPSILKTASLYSMRLIPGIASIGEAMQAAELGFDDLRPCPGDLNLCRQLNQYMPQVKLYPMNIQWDLIEQFLDLPSVAAVGLTNPDPLQIMQINESLHI